MFTRKKTKGRGGKKVYQPLVLVCIIQCTGLRATTQKKAEKEGMRFSSSLQSCVVKALGRSAHPSLWLVACALTVEILPGLMCG